LIQVGQAVTYVDSLGIRRPAIVTNVGQPDKDDTWLNVVVVVLDENQSDTYGRKIERFTSVSHFSKHGAAMPGNYWTGE